MNVKDAVRLAKNHIIELFNEEDVRDIGLEEVELEENLREWIITIGFSRPWDQPRNTLASLSINAVPRRAYKIVRISDITNEVLSVKNKTIQSE